MTDSNPGQMFSVPENDSRVMDSWERLLGGVDQKSSDPLRRLIDDSWRRCYGASVNPELYQAPPPIGEHQLYSLRDDCSDLVSASAPIMASARSFLSETGTVMVLTDQNGTILNIDGDEPTRRSAEHIHLLSGANWDELICGTNAVGTALAVGQPVQIHSAEHYCAGIKRWTCSATVIRDPYDNAIVGTIDVSGLNDSFNKHILPLVITTAGRIENQLAKIELDLRYRLLEGCLDRLSETSSDGMIVFDRRGRAIKANGKASAVLSSMGVRELAATRDGLANLTLSWKKGQGMPSEIPEWIRPEWLEPVMMNGKCLGAVLMLPSPSRGKTITGRRSAPEFVNETEDKGSFERIVGNSEPLLRAITRAQQLAKSRVPVLLLGETGVGKDVFARCIHESGSSKDAPFVALNCGVFSRELLTSELFGYSDGAFTGARKGGMIGKIEAANGGTLFLDEIGEMPIDLQPHFLRVLEEREVYRLGENKPRKVDFRLVAATNRDLRKEIQAGRFRMDLFYRVAVTSITIPSLQDRVEDITLLGDHYLKQYSQQYGMEVKTLSSELVKLLQQYAWPGNIREFRNVMESMLLTSTSQILTELDLPDDIRAELKCSTPTAITSEQPAEPNDLTSLENAERDAIIRSIKACRGNMTSIAKELGIAKSTVYVKVKRFGLESQVDSFRNQYFDL